MTLNYLVRVPHKGFVTYRDQPAADVFVQVYFYPQQDIHTLVPEGLCLNHRLKQKKILMNDDKEHLAVLL